MIARHSALGAYRRAHEGSRDDQLARLLGLFDVALVTVDHVVADDRAGRSHARHLGALQVAVWGIGLSMPRSPGQPAHAVTCACQYLLSRLGRPNALALDETRRLLLTLRHAFDPATPL